MSIEEGGKKCPSVSQRGQQQESVCFWGFRPCFFFFPRPLSPESPHTGHALSCRVQCSTCTKQDEAFFNFMLCDSETEEYKAVSAAQNMVLPMSTSWLCCRASPLLCSCFELFRGRLRMFCLPVAHRIQSRHLPLGQGFLSAERR